MIANVLPDSLTDNKLSLAIGRRGPKRSVGAHLTGYRIDIKSASEYEALKLRKLRG